MLLSQDQRDDVESLRTFSRRTARPSYHSQAQRNMQMRAVQRVLDSVKAEPLPAGQVVKSERCTNAQLMRSSKQTRVAGMVAPYWIGDEGWVRKDGGIRPLESRDEKARRVEVSLKDGWVDFGSNYLVTRQE